MSSEVDRELRELVIDNWGLVHELHERAEEVATELLQRIQDAYCETGDLETHALTTKNIVKSGSAWYVAFPGAGHPYVSYVQVQVVKTEPRFTTEVFTAFRSIKGVGVLELKKTVSEELGASAGVDYDMAGGNCTVARCRIEMAAHDEDAHVQHVVAEIARHTTVAEALRKAISSRVESSP